MTTLFSIKKSSNQPERARGNGDAGRKVLQDAKFSCWYRYLVHVTQVFGSSPPSSESGCYVSMEKHVRLQMPGWLPAASLCEVHRGGTPERDLLRCCFLKRRW